MKKTIAPYRIFDCYLIPKCIMDRNELSFGEKCLYPILTNYVSSKWFAERYWCFPSRPKLASLLGIKREATVTDLTTKLQNNKLIEVHQLGQKYSNLYILLYQDWMPYNPASIKDYNKKEIEEIKKEARRIQDEFRGRKPEFSDPLIF